MEINHKGGKASKIVPERVKCNFFWGALHREAYAFTRRAEPCKYGQYYYTKQVRHSSSQQGHTSKWSDRSVPSPTSGWSNSSTKEHHVQKHDRNVAPRTWVSSLEICRPVQLANGSSENLVQLNIKQHGGKVINPKQISTCDFPDFISKCPI